VAKKKKKPSDDDVKPSKKNRKRAEDDEDEFEDEDDRSDDSARPRNNVYVGLGAITLLALITAAVFLYLDHDANSKKNPPTVSVSVAELKLGK
jgi:hypothetical protein